MKSATRQKWEGRWEQLKGRAKELWGVLTDDDFQKMEGNYDRLVGIIQERTGEAREAIEKRLDPDQRTDAAGGCCPPAP